MAQVFPRRMNTVARVSLFGGLGLLALLGWVLGVYYRAPWVSWVDVPRRQPVPFSHKHHVGEGFDCRYCHTSVEESSFAGIPPTKTCMNCHSMIWSDSQVLAPIRESFRTGNPIHWKRVNAVADFVFFDHSIHVAKGIGCVSCHGRVDQMPLTWRAERLQMEFCLGCHRNPELNVRPRAKVFDMEYEPPADQEALGRALVEEYGIRKLDNCTTCHR